VGAARPDRHRDDRVLVLRALLPLLVGAPLVLRRRAPLLTWLATCAGMALAESLLTVHSRGAPPQGLEFTVTLLAAAYSLGAHASLRRAVAGLAVAAPVVPEISYMGALGLVFSQHSSLSVVELTSLELLAFWVAGVLVRARRQAASLTARSAGLQRQAEQAAAAERARIGRELHDIIAHHLSVVVLHAAGARAAGGADPATLEEIEHSGRQALTETRRLFGVLRDPDQETGRAPQPGICELPALADRLRAAGLEVSLFIDGDHAALPQGVNVSAYRIVQEALTNVLKHANPARAEVTVVCADGAVTIEVTDDGPGNPAPPASRHDQRPDRRRPGPDPQGPADAGGSRARPPRGRRGRRRQPGPGPGPPAGPGRHLDGRPHARARRHPGDRPARPGRQ
jgi:signal transduction histidine kinase